MPILTADQLETELDEQLRWRLREISAVHNFVSAANSPIALNAALRAGVTTIYSHWEGYIKRSAELYLEYIFSQRVPIGEVRREIASYFLEPSFRAAGGYKKTFGPQKAIEFVEQVQNRRLKPRTEIRVSTKANLRFDVFSEIATQLGLSDFIGNVDEHFINSKLCDKRNAIAHGATAPLTADDFETCRLTVTDLMRSFKYRIVTAANNSEYVQIRAVSGTL